MARQHAAMKAMHCLESCTENSSVRTGVHDKVQVIWMLMLKSAGFESVRLEDRSFDAAATADDKDHRRPDIVCVWVASGTSSTPPVTVRR